MSKLAIITHPDCLKHDTGPMHPESIARLEHVMNALKRCDFQQRLQFVDAPFATPEQIAMAHDAAYIAAVARTPSMLSDARPSLNLDPDTVLSNGSHQAALRAAGAACKAVEMVMDGAANSVFCAVRPPGHHALPDRSMGFCIFNNIALAVHVALQHKDVGRVAVVDFDVHHGNGTQDIFERDPRVLFVSTHQYPFWPGTGAREETGAGNILNIPVPAGTEGAAYRTLFEREVIPALEQHKPQLLFISAGFDAHKSDPLAGLRLDEEDYEWIGQRLHGVARSYCGGKSISLLEGGYDLAALAASVVAYLRPFVN